jgi:hypothetical protein
MISMQVFLTHLIFGLLTFYVGLMVGMSTTSSSTPLAAPVTCPKCPDPVASVQQQQQQQQQALPTTKNAPFPSTVSRMFVDYATVPRDDFNELLEIGVPLDDTVEGAESVVVLYTSRESLPNNAKVRHGLDAKSALQNCQSVKVILQEPAPKRGQQCLAIVPQWESYYVHKFMRLVPNQNTGGVDKNLPLKYVSRSHTDKGSFQKVPNLKLHTAPSYPILVEYLQNLDRLLQEVKAVLTSEVVSKKGSKSVIVLVCNYGQVELFHNYVCNAKAKNLDLSNILMFATDTATLELCRTLGIPAYYDEAIFGSLPETAAKYYGDRTFSKMMMAKVYCVHLVLSLGYNVLFQDVDVIWYKNPLPYLENSPETQEWDLMFQDDGARSVRYAPYSPNTGTSMLEWVLLCVLGRLCYVVLCYVVSRRSVPSHPIPHSLTHSTMLFLLCRLLFCPSQ